MTESQLLLAKLAHIQDQYTAGVDTSTQATQVARLLTMVDLIESRASLLNPTPERLPDYQQALHAISYLRLEIETAIDNLKDTENA